MEQRDAWQEMALERDKKLFTQTVTRIGSKQGLDEFVAAYGLDNFNATLKELNGDQLKEVTGRVERIRLGL